MISHLFKQIQWNIHPNHEECIQYGNLDHRHDHFTMDAREQFDAVKNMRVNKLKLAAVYHSHPETPARPSQEDIRLAFDPEISYVIVSLACKKPAVKSFKIKGL